MNNAKNIAKDEKSEYNYTQEGTLEEIRNTPKSDVIFKMLFGKEGNENILKDFLEAILDIEIKSVNLNEGTVLLAEELGGKAGVLDVRATLNDGTKIDIEMQNYYELGIEARTAFYLSKMYTQYIPKGTAYSDISRAIVIFILNYNHFEELESFHSYWHWSCDNKADLKLRNQELHIIELPKFRKQVPDLSKKITQWLIFLDHKNEELVNMASKKNENIKEAQEKLDKIIADKHAQYLQELELKAEMDKAEILKYHTKRAEEEGMARGMEKGMAEGKIAVAKKLLQLGMPIKEISEATELSCEEIEKL